MQLNEEVKRARRRKENLIFFGLVYLILSIFCIRLGLLINNGYNLDAEFISITINSLKEDLFLIPNSKDDLKIFLIFTFVYSIVVLNSLTKNEKLMPGKEYGSAKWGTKKDIKPFKDKIKDDNIILTQTEQFSIHPRKTMRNNNILVVGGSGTGKTRFFLKPNLMQMHSSYVITDPKGEILRDTGNMLRKNGYKIKVLDLYEIETSHKYNPFKYVNSETDILKLITNLIKNTNPSGTNSGDPFWEKSETALFQSLFAFTWKYISEEEQNFSTILRLLEKIEVKEDDENFKSEMDIIMEHYNDLDPNNFAYRQWLIFKQAGGKTAKSILISAGVRLSVFNIQAIADLTSKDELEIEKIGDEKTALFILISDSDATLNFIVSILYQQLFDILYYQADFINNGHLKYQVRCLIDEFANIGQIPEFEKKLSTMRSRGISASIIIQNIAQLEALYKDHWKTIIGNCDTFLYLGGIEKDSHKYVSELLGKTTIDNKSRGRTRGRQSSTNENYQRLGRDLLTPDEVGGLDNKECILFFRGLNPFLSNKYKLEEHKRYKELFDGKGKNLFDFKKFKEEDDKKYRILALKKEIKKQEMKNTFTEKELTEKDLEKILEEDLRTIDKNIALKENKVETKYDKEIDKLKKKLEGLKTNHDKNINGVKINALNRENLHLEIKDDKIEELENKLDSVTEKSEDSKVMENIDNLIEQFDDEELKIL